MNHEEILKKIEELGPWFHAIDLGNGIVTKKQSVAGEPADHPRGTWQIIAQCLPADLTGKRVIDVGCNAGFFSIEAKKRNAEYILGVDSQRREIRQAHFVRRVLGLDIHFRRLSVYDLSRHTVGQYDITLALGLIYHCKHAVLALERLFEITRDLLILETAILPPQVFADTPFNTDVGGRGLLHHPLAYVENLSNAKEAVYNWFVFSPRAAQALLKTVGFEDVQIFDISNSRAVLTARKPASLSGEIINYLSAALTLLDGPEECSPGVEIIYHFQIENTGMVGWSALGEAGTERGAIQLGAHLFKDSEEIVWDYSRALLSRDILPDETAMVEIHLRAPITPGIYVIEFDLVAEGLTWFEDAGSRTIPQTLVVK